MGLRLTLASAFVVFSLAQMGLAAEPLPTMPRELRSNPATVDATSRVEVFQVLTLANGSQLQSADLALLRDVSEDIRDFAEDMKRDHGWMQTTLETWAGRKGISLRPEDLTPTAQLVKRNVDGDYEMLAQKSTEDFEASFLRVTLYQYAKILKLYDEVDQKQSDPELLSLLTVLRPMIQRNQSRIMQLMSAPSADRSRSRDEAE